jgi:hypothetical protein
MRVPARPHGRLLMPTKDQMVSSHYYGDQIMKHRQGRCCAYPAKHLRTTLSFIVYRSRQCIEKDGLAHHKDE